ncbi:MAG: response regulator [Tissierellia bacterium]|nr:response regulator [Tissierellia bacterium]
MRFFILDDDMNVIQILKRIIEDKELGVIVGQETDGLKGMEKIKAIRPDIVLIDLLMPGMDGLNIVKKLKEEYDDIEFIMISQVSSKDMVEKAYQYGVEYFIYKPINAVEVETIIRKVMERIHINRTISSMQGILSGKRPAKTSEAKQSYENRLNSILTELGIIGEKGSQDIIAIVKYVMENKINLNEITIKDLLSKFTDNPKSMEQRMRRAINMALTNIANLGIEDYMNYTFTEYSNTLFNFEQVRSEMEYIRGNMKRGGSTNIKKFLIGLIYHIENINN